MQQLEKQIEKITSSGSREDTGGRLKKLFEHYHLTTYQANQKLGYGKGSKLYKLLGNEVRPGYETLVDILTAFPELSPTWLLMGTEPMLIGPVVSDAAPLAPVSQQRVAISSWTPLNGGRVLTITVDREGKDNIELVPVHAQTGYTQQHNEQVVTELKRYRIPGFETGKFRAFEVFGDSMEPTINHGDIVVASFVDDWKVLEPGAIYVVVTNESVLLKRIRERIKNLDKEVWLYADNYSCKPYELEAAAITEVWRVRGYVSSYLPSAPDVTAERLWEVIKALNLDKTEVRRHLEETAPNAAPSQ